MSTQEQNTLTFSDDTKLITRAQFSEVIERAYKAGVMAERKGKHTFECFFQSLTIDNISYRIQSIACPKIP